MSENNNRINNLEVLVCALPKDCNSNGNSNNIQNNNNVSNNLTKKTVFVHPDDVAMSTNVSSSSARLSIANNDIEKQINKEPKINKLFKNLEEVEEAFQVPVKRDILSVIRSLDAEDVNEDEGDQRQLHRRVRSRCACCNVTRRLTLVLRRTYSEIKAAQSFPNFKRNDKGHTNDFSGGISGPRQIGSAGFPTNDQGHLVLGDSCPIMKKRYQLTDMRANGTFSQIYNAVDLFLNRRVVIKVLRVGYGMLGRREVAFLQHLSTKTVRGRQCCKTSLHIM